MDQEKRDKREKFRNQVREILNKMTLDELSYTLGRYCGPSNAILSDKKFGFSMPQDLVEEALSLRAMEDILFGKDQ